MPLLAAVGTRRALGLVLGPLLAVIVLSLPLPEGLSREGLRVAAVAVLMATWWITEAIPIPATALLPIALFPALGVMGAAQTTSAYANHLIYLFLGGFLIAVTVQRWDLHRRIALITILVVGVTPRRILLGFMLATAFLSMWISNTATTMMMVPIGTAVIAHAVAALKTEGLPADGLEAGASGFAVALMLGVAYGASIGGVATLIGTPPNAVLAGVVESTYGVSISFVEWFIFALPLSMVFLIIAWLYLSRFVFRGEIDSFPGGRELVAEQLRALGPMTVPQRRVLTVFLSVAALWILRGFVDIEALSLVQDSTIAIAGGLALFLIPADLKRGEFLLDWPTAVKIPWDILILFGGGFALAGGFAGSGLTQWLAGELDILQGAPVAGLVFAVALLVIFMSEVTSNTATASLVLPVMAAFSSALGVHPYALMVSAAIAASFAFMMPVATPPNAIVFASRYVTITRMVKVGVWLNLMGAVILSAFVLEVLPWLWDIRLDEAGPAALLPDAAVNGP